MKKYFALILLLIPFGVKGQDTIIKSQFPPMGYWFEPIQVEMSDTPQADRNPNDFYIDSLTRDSHGYTIYPDNNGDTSYVMNTPHGRISSKDLSLEEKLLQYAAECWSDSILNVYAKDSTYAPLKGVGIFYIHREPTFKGFIEYLKKK